MMQTVAISLTDSAWTSVSSDHSTVAIDIKTAGQILIHLGGDAAPDIGAPGIGYAAWNDGPDAVFEGLTSADRVWCRSISPSAEIVVSRK